MDRVKKRRNEYWENYSELKGKRLLNIKEEDVVNKFRSELWEKIILKKEIEKKRQNLNKEIANIEKEIELNSKRMLKAASDLHFEKAAHFRDRVRHLRELLMEMTSHPSTPTSETFSKSNTPK